MSSSLEEFSTTPTRDPFRDRTAPRAPEAEQAVIAAMLMDTDAILRAGEHVDDTMFYDERHRRIFRAMIAISQRSEVVDPVTLVNELRRRGASLGAAALCGGGGQGDAAIVRAL